MSSNPLSQNIAKYRKAAGLTQEDLGRLLSVSMQAVSRWERGGAPDLALLPDLANALGITIDELFNYTSKKPQNPSVLLRKEISRTPEEQRFTKANDLALELLKLVIDANDNSSDTLYQFISLHERTDRKQNADPSAIPTLIHYAADQGIMSASIAADFQYTLLMPEPEDGYAALMKNEEEYIRLFQLLEKPYRLRALAYSHTRQKRAFTAALFAQDTQIDPELAEEVLAELSRHNLLQNSQIDTHQGPLNTYTQRAGSSLIPFLYFGAELMRTKNQHVLVVPSRSTPLMRGRLGENGLFPEWIPETPPTDA